MTTHDLSTVGHFADRIVVMYFGRIVESGPARSVVRDPQHPYTRALLSAVPPQLVELGRSPGRQVACIRADELSPSPAPTAAGRQ